MAHTLQERPRLQARRLVRPKDVVCPAGSFCAGVTSATNGVICEIEDSLVSLVGQPHSLAAFCLGDYQACPTWLAEKERIAEANRTALVDQ